ncbi:MAG: hypothetical protein QW299_00425 [Candidatus Caldarchaeum sp.]
MDGLIVKQPYANHIINRLKKWEMWTKPPPKGKIGRCIYLLSAGYVLGIIMITGVKGPFNQRELKQYQRFHLGASPRYKYACVVKVVKKFRRPRKYVHPWGAQVWVRDVKYAR